jgi:hypothetical protein
MLKARLTVKTFAKENGLNSLTNLLEKVPFLSVNKIDQRDISYGIDYSLWVNVKDQQYLILVQVQKSGQPRIVRQSIFELGDELNRRPGAYGVVIAPFLSEDSRQMLEKAGIGFVDLAGNCLISFETIYIQQSGFPNPFSEKRMLRSLYSPKSERVLRVLLSEPGRVWKLNELASTAEVSIGLASNVKRLLSDREWISSLPSGLTLINPRALLSEWAQAYRPSRSIAQDYYASLEIVEIEALLAETCQELRINYALAGFSSASRISPMVRYQRASSYANGDLTRLIESRNWKPVSSGGNIRLIIPYDDGVYWDARFVDGIRITSPVQTYLDLQGDPGRGQEAAAAVLRELEKTW